MHTYIYFRKGFKHLYPVLEIRQIIFQYGCQTVYQIR